MSPRAYNGKGVCGHVEDFTLCPVSGHSQGSFAEVGANAPLAQATRLGLAGVPGNGKPHRGVLGLEPLSIDGFLFLNYALISSPSGTNAYVLMSSLP